MAEPIFPAGITSRGNVKLQFVTTIADLDAPSLAEITAVSSLDISCMLADAGWKPSITQNKGDAKRRICSKAGRKILGETMYELSDLLYSNNPQGAAASDGVKAAEKLVPNTSGIIVERLALDSIDTDWAVGQFVNLWPVNLGEQMDEYDLTDEFGEFWIRQALVAAGTGAPTRKVALVA
ncbi:hypothetical protein HMPREF0063_10053 [Aeromicrobium marinum DSM 15272]|uniref:Uncharacterized protein n=1 Tax=Aeromicrobium marinum DSM 15272 TaxID=585531 RepID=E2S7P6_9ACTN|nr:hypothetical protein [Aeromicrobium marinum]EFQ84712.1 hypothetical protein HMPREF0063_10053 [Aeromicrobium marinum DSM 15272]